MVGWLHHSPHANHIAVLIGANQATTLIVATGDTLGLKSDSFLNMSQLDDLCLVVGQ